MRLLTLIGPAGVGKTRLALELAASLLHQFEDGILFVDLASICDPRGVTCAVAQTLGVSEAGERPLLERVTDVLRDQRLLLVLDNFEQVLGAAGQVAELLAASPGLKVLVTSRAALHLRSEHEFPVPPLGLPELSRLPDLEALSATPAVTLFVERARAVKPDLMLSHDNARAVAEICTRLDGLPLAIELAAARSKILPPGAMLARLQKRLDLLTGNGADLPARHRTLREAIGWSYDLLDTGEQALFRRLAPFVDGCTLEAVEAVCNAGDLDMNVVDGVASLVDKSLLRQGESTDGEPRFCMLDTIREYALERLLASDEAEVIRRQHADFFLALAEQAEPELLGARQAAWLDRLQREHGNLRAVLGWSIEDGEVETGLRLAGALRRFWSADGYLNEQRELLARLLALPEASAPTAGRAKTLIGAARLAYVQGDYAEAGCLSEQSRMIATALGDRALVAESITQLGHVARARGDYAAAQALYRESLAIERELGDRWGIAISGKCLGHVARAEGDYAAAQALYQDSLAIERELGDRWGMASSLYSLGDIAHDQGDYAEARARYGESLAMWRDLPTRWCVAYVLQGLAGLAAAEGQPERALRLAGAAAARRDVDGAPLTPAEHAKLERRLEPARRMLPQDVAAEQWTAGQEMPLEEAIAYALAEESADPADVALPEGPSSDGEMIHLTRREREVVALIARGLTNRQIAAALVIAEGTAAIHVKNLLRKLGFRSRAQVAAWAVQQGLSMPPED